MRRQGVIVPTGATPIEFSSIAPFITFMVVMVIVAVATSAMSKKSDGK